MKTLYITVCTHDQYRDIVGIHLNCPDLFYLSSTVSSTNGHRTIFCHYDRVGPAKFILPYDVLTYLIELHGENVQVSFTHPSA